MQLSKHCSNSPDDFFQIMNIIGKNFLHCLEKLAFIMANTHLTCLLSVIALGWHLVQIPSGHGGCPSHPDLILQLMFSRATNFPLNKRRNMLNIFLKIPINIQQTSCQRMPPDSTTIGSLHITP